MSANDDRVFPKLSEGYCFDEKGLGKNIASQGGSERRKICCDSIPTDIEKVILKDDISQTQEEGYKFSIENKCGDKTAPILCTVKEMVSGKLYEKISPYVIYETYPGAKKEVCRVYEQIIKTACVGTKAVEMYVNQFGWNGKRFIWDKTVEPDKGEKYADAVGVCGLVKEHDVTLVALIGAVHGFMKKPLQEAGIRHDYVDMVVGSTGIGKSASLKAICNYHVRSGNIYSAGSNRKAVRLQMEGNADQTVVLDDFCKTKSDRVSVAQDQLVSEIIQASSDAARVINDKDSKTVTDPALRIHIMVSAERTLRNESTINRCFLYEMENPLSPEAFLKMKELEKEGSFYRFLVALSRFIGGGNYDCEVEEMAKDYEYYKSETGRLGTCTCGSDHRINETYAVQMVLVRVIMRYLNSLALDEELKKKIEKAFTDCIAGVCREMKAFINELHNQDTHKEYLKPLADIILRAIDYKEWQGYYYVYHSEEKYLKHKGKVRDCLLFCVEDGYASFEGKCMCEVMENEYGVSGANTRGLSSNLQHYALAHVGSDDKLSCHWGTKKRYYHVRVSELLELICPDIDSMRKDRIKNLFQKKQ